MWIMRHTLGSNEHKTILVNGYYSSPISNGGIIGENWPIYPPRWGNAHARPNRSTLPWLVLTWKTNYRGKNTLSYSAGAGTLLTLAFRAAEFPLISPLRQFPSKQQWSRMCSLVWCSLWSTSCFIETQQLVKLSDHQRAIRWTITILVSSGGLTFSRATHSCRLDGSVSFQAQCTGGCSVCCRGKGLFGWKISAMWKL